MYDLAGKDQSPKWLKIAATPAKFRAKSPLRWRGGWVGDASGAIWRTQNPHPAKMKQRSRGQAIQRGVPSAGRKTEGTLALSRAP